MLDNYCYFFWPFPLSVEAGKIKLSIFKKIQQNVISDTV